MLSTVSDSTSAAGCRTRCSRASWTTCRRYVFSFKERATWGCTQERAGGRAEAGQGWAWEQQPQAPGQGARGGGHTRHAVRAQQGVKEAWDCDWVQQRPEDASCKVGLVPWSATHMGEVLREVSHPVNLDAAEHPATAAWLRRTAAPRWQGGWEGVAECSWAAAHGGAAPQAGKGAGQRAPGPLP